VLHGIRYVRVLGFHRRSVFCIPSVIGGDPFEGLLSEVGEHSAEGKAERHQPELRGQRKHEPHPEPRQRLSIALRHPASAMRTDPCPSVHEFVALSTPSGSAASLAHLCAPPQVSLTSIPLLSFTFRRFVSLTVDRGSSLGRLRHRPVSRGKLQNGRPQAQGTFYGFAMSVMLVVSDLKWIR
jgi:hypothetical protein